MSVSAWCGRIVTLALLLVAGCTGAIKSAGDPGGVDASPILVDGGSGPDAAGFTFTFTDTSDGIHAFLVGDALIPLGEIPAAATHADFVWGAGGLALSEPEKLAAFRAANSRIVLSRYIPFTRDYDASPAHDLDYWKGVHPDWVVYQCDQVTPAYEYGKPNVPLDISNPLVVDYQIATYAVTAGDQGFDAIAADNFSMENDYGSCGVFRNGIWTQLYSGAAEDPVYTSNVVAWTTTFAHRLHSLTPRPLALVLNFSRDHFVYTDPQVLSVVAAVDGILDEAGFTGGAARVDEYHWTRIVDFMVAVQLSGKAYFVINEFADAPPLSLADVQWALASYLMGKRQAASIFVSGVQDYNRDNWRDEFGAAIGTPCDDVMQHSAAGLYSRLFKHGLALANPTTAAAAFTLPAGTWTDLYGNAVTSSVMLGNGSGMVLLQTGAANCP